VYLLIYRREEHTEKNTKPATMKYGKNITDQWTVNDVQRFENHFCTELFAN